MSYPTWRETGLRPSKGTNPFAAEPRCATTDFLSASGLPQTPTRGRAFASAARPTAHGRAEALPKFRRSRYMNGRPIDGNRASTRNFVPAGAADVPHEREAARYSL